MSDTVYLGGNVNEQISEKKEITARISATFQIWKASDEFWKNAKN